MIIQEIFWTIFILTFLYGEYLNLRYKCFMISDSLLSFVSANFYILILSLFISVALTGLTGIFIDLKVMESVIISLLVILVLLFFHLVWRVYKGIHDVGDKK